jgi:HlyD family secretion protein
MKKKVIIGVVAIAVVATAILVFGLFKGGQNGKAKYRTVALAKGDIEALVVTSGTLDAVTVVEVGCQVSGKIAKLYADFNSHVKAGEILAELDMDILKAKVDQNEANYKSSTAALDQAKVQLENLKKKYNRSLDLFQRNLISIEEKEMAEANYLGATADLKTAEARLSQAKSQLDSSKVDLSYAVIRSPIDGIVITRNVNLGQTVAASFQAPVLFKIASDLTKMQVQCNVDEADIGKLKEGQKVRFTVDAFPQDTFFGTVRQVRYASQVVQNVVTYTTIVDANNSDLKLRPGMTATISVVVGEAKGVLKVPNAALRFTPNIPAEELQKIFKEVGDRMRAQRQAGQPADKPQGDRTQNTPESVRQGQGGSLQSGEMTPEMMVRYQQARNRRGGGQVWIQDDQGKLNLVFIRTGVTDNTYSEITRSELKEGMKVIIGEENPKASSSTSSQQGPGGQRGGPGQMMIFR